MFKLQVVLVPPSARNSLLPYGMGPNTAETSQIFGMSPLANARNADSTLPYAANCNASGILVHHFTTKTRKFLHFTRSANTLLELSTEIVEKCNKMYPYLDELEILSLQDSQGCDLDPDFLVKDVFTMDNVVRAIIKKELEIEDSAPVSSYRAAKKKKLNSGFVQNTGPAGVLNIAKKRSAALAMRNPTPSNNGNGSGSNNNNTNNTNNINNNMRVSTPLANQIYPPPPPSSESKIEANNSEYDYEGEQAERSFLPPPAQPQSPPIRVSSGIDHTKKIKSIVEDDTVSRSETVDPDKLRQQRLLSGSPIRSTRTPNRVTLTGQRVVSENQPTYLSNPHSNRQTSTATRVSSGRLNIPEPKISEIEKELKEGPSSPSSVLPPKPDRIPMKRPLQEVEARRSEEDLNTDDVESDESERRKVKQIIQRQTSIADNNGSPTKNGPLSEENVQLAELPIVSARPQRERRTSLEDKVENKSPNGRGLADDERLRISNFSEDEDEGLQEKERDKQLEGELDKGKRQLKSQETETNYESDDESANDTVVVRDTRTRSPGNRSINREDLLRFMEGDRSPIWNEGSPSRKKKPYTTVLNKDIDNSKPDPRNILPERMTRHAAKKATQLLAGKRDISSESNSDSDSERELEEPSSEDQSSGIDSSIEDNEASAPVSRRVRTRTLHLHPLKETVVKTDPKYDQRNEFRIQEGTLNSGKNGQLNKNEDLQEQEKIIIQQPGSEKTATSPKGSSSQRGNEVLATESSQKNVVSNRVKSQSFSSKIESHRPSSAPFPGNNPNGTERLKSISSLIPDRPKGLNSDETRELRRSSTSIDSKSYQVATDGLNKEKPGTRRKLGKEERMKLKQQEAENKKKEKELEKQRQKEELERLKKQQFQRQQEELERRKREFYEKKQQDVERQRKQEEEARRVEAEVMRKRQEELKARRQKELEKERQEEEEKRRQAELERQKREENERKQAELERRKQEFERKQAELERQKREEAERKQAESERRKREEADRKKAESERQKREELERKRQQEELERKKLQEIEEKNKREELERKKQLEAEKKQEEIEKKKQEELEKKQQQEEIQRKKQIELSKRKREEKLVKSTISRPARAKSPAVTNGSDKLKELKARFTSPKSYVPTSKNGLQNGKSNEGDEESESSDDESSTEYSSSSDDDDDDADERESNSKKSRRMIVDTPKGSLSSSKQKSTPKQTFSQGSIEAAPQSTQRSSAPSQSSQNEAPISQFFHSPEKAQSRFKDSSGILDGLPKKVRPSLSSLSDLASRGVPEVRDKVALSPPPRISKTPQKKIATTSENDDSDENDGSDTESENSDSESDDSDSSDSGFISAKSAGLALGKKKKGGGGFASLLRDSQRR